MQRDVVLRWIAQLSVLIARLLRRDPTLSLELAGQYLEEAEAQVLGPLAALVRKLDPPSAARLLGDPDRIWGYGQVLALASALRGAEGAPAEAEALGRRAVAVAREARRRAIDPPPEWSEWIAAAERDLADGGA
jgi:hypothetical protein